MASLTKLLPFRPTGAGRVGTAVASWLRLAPVWVVAVEKDRSSCTFRLRHNIWTGQPKLVSAELPVTNGSERAVSAIAVIDSALPYRRKLQRFPDTAGARQALLRSAVDEFPFPPEDLDFGLGIRSGDGYLYALPRAVRAELEPTGARIEAVLVADGSPRSASVCMEALSNFERLGPTLSLGASPRFIPRRHLLNLALGSALLGCLATALVLVLQPPWLHGLIEARVDQLREQVGELPRIYAATESMARARDAAAQYAADPAAKLPGELARLFATVPAGHAIRRAEFSNGLLRIAGIGAEPSAWLKEAGFPADGITIEQTPGVTTWRAEKPIR